ncbi:MAG: YhdP family protein, partial [Terriglobales bacterium]
FDALSAQISWARSSGETELWINNVSFSNAHVAGTVFGVYRTAGTTNGSIDLTGRLTRADARYVGRYVPLVLGKSVRDWLDIALIAGHSSNVTLRLKGKLDEFPFPDGKSGVFQVTARVSDGVLHYADGWPDIGNIAGDVTFRGQRMEVNAWQGAIFGVRLSKVRAEIPDLSHENEVLSVSGDAEGPTSDFFAFIEKSPVAGFTDHFTRGWQAQGTGRLALTLSIPLRDAAKSTVAGNFQFASNTVTISPELPVMEQAGGRIEFTETALRAQTVKGVVLGGPVTISAAASRDVGVRVGFQGRINADTSRRAGGPPWIRYLRGAADWRGSLTARRGGSADFVIESNLQGLAVNLPAPLVK